MPVTASAINHESKEMVRLGKSQKVEKRKKSKRELPLANNALGLIQQNILNNSWIKQPELAFGASLALMATLVARKVVFGNLSPNLYILNISPSGSGKDAPQQMLKSYLVGIGADYLLGAGDYVSGEWGAANVAGTDLAVNYVTVLSAHATKFDGENLDGPPNGGLDGPQGGIATFTPPVSLGGLGAVADSVVITLTLSDDISGLDFLDNGVVAEFGSDAAFVTTPEPGTILLLGLGSLTLLRRKRK